MTLFEDPSTPQPIDNFQVWLSGFAQPTVLHEFLALVVCIVLAWSLVATLRRALGYQHEYTIMFGRKTVDGVFFPAALLCFGYVARTVLGHYMPVALFKIIIPVLLALVTIRVGVKVLQVAFAKAPWVRTLEHTISWIAWLAMVLWVSGLLPVMLKEMEQITWKMGAATVSVRSLLEGLLTAGAVLIATLWISAAIESRLLRSATGGELSLRKAGSNAARALMMFLGVILALSAAGIDLTALSVLGGAVGVGIGFGLQKLAANYVSGFVILAERSMRIGDTVKVDNFEGVITEINARYTVVLSASGSESIVPNELLITSRVENMSLADPKVHQSTTVTVGYDSDVDLVIELLMQAAAEQERVLRDPAPSVALSSFGTDGLVFTLSYWIDDVTKGPGNLRSSVNLAILRALRTHRIEIPYPQRVLHQR